MSNVLLTSSVITNEALDVLTNNLTFGSKVNRKYDDKFGVEGAKIGTTLNVRKPVRYIGRTGQALQVEDSVETYVPVVLDTQFGVDINFTSADLLLNITDFSRQFIKPAMATIANKIDFDGLALYKDIYSNVGTPGTTPNALLTYLSAGVALDNNLCPMDGERNLCLTPLMQAYAVDSLKGLFQSAEQIKQQYEKGKMGIAAGFNWYMDQNVSTHTIGALGGTPLVNGASQTGNSLITDGWTAAAATRLNIGDVFTVANVFLVNGQSRQTTNVLQPFVVTAPGISDGSGNMTIQISPPMTATGAFQTINALPADNAALTIFGAASTVTPQGMAFHRDAFTLASADLPLPRGVDMASRASDPEVGISVRMVRSYDINADRFPCRLDVLYGWRTLRPELACRISA